MRFVLICGLLLMLSCGEKNSTQQANSELIDFEFAILDDAPIFEDEYLYPKETKQALLVKEHGIDFYLIDWDGNSNHSEYGVDYLGVKSSLERKPTIEKLDTSMILQLNGELKSLNIDKGDVVLTEYAGERESDMSLVSKLFPMEMENRDTYMPAIEQERLVIYFWATWCKPCVKTLKSIGPNIDKLEADGIQFVPIAYNCSGSEKFLESNNLDFEDLIISKAGAKSYNIQALSKQYTFNKDGSIAKENIKLSEYY